MRRLTQEAHIVKSEFERWEKIWKAGIIIAENTVTHEQTTVYGGDAYEKSGTPDVLVDYK